MAKWLSQQEGEGSSQPLPHHLHHHGRVSGQESFLLPPGSHTRDFESGACHTGSAQSCSCSDMEGGSLLQCPDTPQGECSKTLSTSLAPAVSGLHPRGFRPGTPSDKLCPCGLETNPHVVGKAGGTPHKQTASGGGE